MEDQATSSDLEQFRQQWQQEVQQKSKKPAESRSNDEDSRSQTYPRPRPERPTHKPSTKHPLSDAKEIDEQHDDQSNQVPSSLETQMNRLEIADFDDDGFTLKAAAEPQSALEHFEKAVEKEAHGNLSESLIHYRKAYRLDDRVDQEYKNKHFAHHWKQSKPNPSNAAPTVPSTAHHSQPAPAKDAAQPSSSSTKPVTISSTAELIDRWAAEEISNAEPVIAGDTPPPCPIRRLPTEVLLELLRHVALFDISIYTRLASVCKKLAYHVHTESSIWRRVALGPETGLASQMYHFATDVQGREAIWQALEDDDDDERPMPVVSDDHFSEEQDWREVLHSYPRIRFTGVYISTVNYTRSGGAASSWGNQIHVVTYYRYLRFFRDGTCISLLTTHEPTEVVNFLTKENVALVRSNKEPANPLIFASNAPASSQQPGAKGSASSQQNAGKGKSEIPVPPSAQNIMKHALRGRWRLCHPSLSNIEIGSNSGAPGDLHIETEGGAGPRYMYTMHLSLKHGNSRNNHAAKNNKLVWKGFWSYNSLTNDWAEFHLRNDKAFWFSRVRSYGLGY